MRLGVSTGFNHTSPKDWAKRHVELGGKAVVFPVNGYTDEKIIDEYVKAAKENDLLIAEVGVWKNIVSPNEKERAEAVEYAKVQLKLADKIGARCCVNVAGATVGDKWDGGYRENFFKDTYDIIVKSVQEIIDAVKPVNTKYSLEPMPWMLPTGPDEYLRLIEDINRPQFGVHMDMINMINSPERYFFQEKFFAEVFEKLGDKILSCHLKDVHLLPEFTFQLRECKCGEGEFNIEEYVRLATLADKDMPMLIEHINSDEEYINNFNYVKNRLEF